MTTKHALMALFTGALVACEGMVITDSGTDSGSQGCCYYTCDDGSGGWRVSESTASCEDEALTTCGSNGLGVSDWSFTDECYDCDDC